MSNYSRIVYNVRVGKPDVTPDRPAHIKGVRQGNNAGLAQQAGIIPFDEGIHNEAHASGERSTGINPRSRNPIDPNMPNLTPA